MQILLASTSTVYGKPYLSYLENDIVNHFKGAKNILFIPFARPGGLSHAQYTAKAALFFEPLGYTLKGMHSFSSVKEALAWAHGVFTGGGNTFVLLKSLYELDAVEALREAIQGGMPYMGASAGTNIAGLSIGTSNDMPIVYPPSFEALKLLPYNFNPHYLDPMSNSTHMGETRETRIGEFHHYNSQPVLGLREGSALLFKNNRLTLLGEHSMRVFLQGKEAFEIPPGDVEL